MNLLLDTHTLLWWLIDSPALSKRARSAISDPDNQAWVSAATGWECATKHRLGKLPEAERFVLRSEELLRRSGIQSLDVKMIHGLRGGSYQVAHADPFDRIIAAQAEIEGMTLVSRDPVFGSFPVRVVW